MALLDDDLTEVASSDIGSRDEHCRDSEEGLSESEYRECESINRAKGYDTRVVKDRIAALKASYTAVEEGYLVDLPTGTVFHKQQ